MRKLMRTATSAAAGATAAYFFDPIAGKGRRTRLKDQMAARVRKVGRRLEKRARYEAGRMKGKVYEATGMGSQQPEDAQTLVDKIRSEVLGPVGMAGRDIEVDVDFDTGEVTLTQMRAMINGDPVRTVPDLDTSRI